MRPMLATKGTHVPAGPEWLHEVKWDGMRVLVDVARRRGCALCVPQRERRHRRLPRAARARRAGRATAARRRGRRARRDGVPTFGALADRMHVAQRPPGRRARRHQPGHPAWSSTCCASTAWTSPAGRWPSGASRWSGSGLPAPHWQVPADVRRRRDAAARRPREQGLEGIVSKRRSLALPPGPAQPDWLKFPHRARRRRTSSAAGGPRPTATHRLGAVLVGRADRGRAASTAAGSAAGIAGKAGPAAARGAARPLRGRRVAVRRRGARGSTPLGTAWVRPEVVVDVAALGLTPAGRLRQPAYRGRPHRPRPGRPGVGGVADVAQTEEVTRRGRRPHAAGSATSTR